MISEKQREANRLNAQKSTGPTSPEGKAASSRNSIRTGFYSPKTYLPSEDQEMYEAMAGSFYDQYQPKTPQFKVLVDDLIRNVWYQQRYDTIEKQFWARDLDHPVAQTFESQSTTYMRLRRCIVAAERRVSDLVRQLKDTSLNIPAEIPVPEPVEVREPEPVAAEPSPQPVEPKPASSENGFVPSTSQTPSPGFPYAEPNWANSPENFRRVGRIPEEEAS